MSVDLSPKGALDSDRHLLVSPEPRQGSEKYFYTFNLCDRLSWYVGSTLRTELAATDSGDQLTWETSQINWVDLKHGRVFKEDAILARSDVGSLTYDPGAPDYNLKVEVQPGGTGSWVEKTEATWQSVIDASPDGDYVFDYATGDVVFHSAIGASDNVRVSGYTVELTSEYELVPATGKRLKLEYVEVQYTTDLDMTSNIQFEIYGNVDIYAPPLSDANGGPVPSGTQIQLVKEIYKTIKDFFQESTGPFSPIPPHGGQWVCEEITGLTNIAAKRNAGYQVIGMRHDGTDWIAAMEKMKGPRALCSPLITIPFNYLAYRDLRDAYSNKLDVNIVNNQELPGEMATVTFYCTTENAT